MIRRSFMKTIGLGGSTTLLSGFREVEPEKESQSLQVGSMNLSDFEIIDAHLHSPRPMTLSESYNTWISDFVNAIIPSYDFDGKTKLQAKMSKVFESHLYNLPRQIGYTNYVARVYGVKPTIEDFDRVISAHLEDFSGYIKSILDREKIPVVVLQSNNPGPVIPNTPIPANRFVWIWPFDEFLMPGWAKSKGFKHVNEVCEEIDQTIDIAVSNKCVGLKNRMATYRPLRIERVEEPEANEALKSLLENEPSGYISPGPTVPQYKDPNLTESLRLYQDYLWKHVFVKAGKVSMPIIIHVAAALHPAYSPEFNNPVGLFDVFHNDEIQRAETQFNLIYGGYPHHHIVASLISQFPNVFTDVTFYSKFPGIMEEELRAFLSLAPSEKIMHGSDSNNVPEEIGYCANNLRRVLAKILNDFKSHYGWTEKDCEKIARNVMSENAKRFFKIKL